jgi:hypothetical protein
VCFDFLYICNIFPSKKKEAICDNKCMLIFKQSTRYSCHILMILVFSTKIFVKYSNIKFHENPCSVSRVVPYVQTDGRRTRQTELIVAFHNCANACENNTIFSCRFIREWHFVFHTVERKRTGSVWKQGASKLFGTKRKEGKGG